MTKEESDLLGKTILDMAKHIKRLTLEVDLLKDRVETLESRQESMQYNIDHPDGCTCTRCD